MQQLETLRDDFDIGDRHAGQVNARTIEACHETSFHRIWADLENDRDGLSGRLQGKCARSAAQDDDDPIWMARHFGGESQNPIDAAFCPAVIDRYALAFDIAGFRETAVKRGRLFGEHCRRLTMKKANDRHHTLLGPRGELTRRRARQTRDELPPPHG